jgi:hypothetical protein
MFRSIQAPVADVAGITARFEALKEVLDERARRLVAAAESQAIGRGGISSVAKATGISRPVIRQGIAELRDPTALPPGRVRRQGGGRKKAVDKDASLKSDLQGLLESTTRGDPEAPLRSSADRRVPFSAGHQQVEQDRTSAVLLYQPELEGKTLAQFRDHRQSHCRHHDFHWPQGSRRTENEIEPRAAQS